MGRHARRRDRRGRRRSRDVGRARRRGRGERDAEELRRVGVARAADTDHVDTRATPRRCSRATTSPKRTAGFLEIVYRNAQRLSQLIDDLLIVDEAEIGASMMQLEPTPLVPLVDACHVELLGRGQQADITLRSDHEADLPAVLVDPLRVEQALTNLVSNALKFTPRAAARSTVNVAGHAETITVSVRDTGSRHRPGRHRQHLRSLLPHQDRGRLDGQGQRPRPRDRQADDRGAERRAARDERRSAEGSTFTMTLPVATRELQRAE